MLVLTTSLHCLNLTANCSEQQLFVSAIDAQAHAISIRGLTKKYGSMTALNNLNLNVVQGEVLGFLGLNGAGKTTAIRLLLDLLRPTSGNAFIFGHDCWHDSIAARARVGYLPGEMGIFRDLTGLEVLDFLAGLRCQPVNKPWRQELIERLELPLRDLRRKIRQYSTGMKRKLGIIQAFDSDPPLLILDEPTEGLDPLMQESFYGLLKDVKQKGKTVFMSSHVLSEVERVCDRVALLRKGELVLLAGLEEMRRLTARQVRVTFARDTKAPASLPPEHKFIGTTPRLWRVEVMGPLGPLLHELEGLAVEDLEVREARLEDVVLKYYREGKG
jgi:ABC-2 type transport system ATP-binding protein